MVTWPRYRYSSISVTMSVIFIVLLNVLNYISDIITVNWLIYVLAT